jgi:hypothetical protein
MQRLLLQPKLLCHLHHPADHDHAAAVVQHTPLRQRRQRSSHRLLGDLVVPVRAAAAGSSRKTAEDGRRQQQRGQRVSI